MKRDDFGLLMDDIYDFTDKIVGTLSRIYIGKFNKLKNISYQELNIMQSVKVVYEEVDLRTREYYLLLAKKVYKLISEYYDFEFIEEVLTMDWIVKQLELYDPVTKYVYIHEVERKSARLAEALIASENKVAEIERGRNLWYRQAKQFADNIVNAAVMQAYDDNDVEYVQWVTEDDERVCAACDALEGKIFLVSEAPPFQHIGCRCDKKVWPDD